MGVDVFTVPGHCKPFWRCKSCLRVGRENWAHICPGRPAPSLKGNWYPSVEALLQADRDWDDWARGKPVLVGTRGG